MDLQLREKRVLVTGGSKGIGYACALAFAQEGAQPILAARDPEALCAAAKSIQEKTGIVPLTHAVDLATQDGITGLAAAAGEVDILVNNAGAIPGGSLEQVDDARWR
ncbi:MAG: SDR family NAD(P)-dependent oxidoreductase, partial [Noviherbaspirillum sp.]